MLCRTGGLKAMIDDRWEKMGGLSCLCFPRRRKVNPNDNGVSEEQNKLKPPDTASAPTGLITIYIIGTIIGLLVQLLSARLNVVTGRHLAELCRKNILWAGAFITAFDWLFTKKQRKGFSHLIWNFNSDPI